VSSPARSHTDTRPNAGKERPLRQSFARRQCEFCGKWLCETLEGRLRKHRCIR